MKKIVLYSVSLAIFLLVGCRDESLNPIPGWESGVHGLAVFADLPEGKLGSSDRSNFADFGKNFPITGQNSAKINFNLRWVSLDNKLTVNKIEVYLDMIESYLDVDGNPKTVSLGNGGKLFKTISPAAANRAWSSFSVTPDDMYNLFKDVVVKYDKKTDVKVFANPSRVRTADARFAPAVTKGPAADVFKLTWRLYTTDGAVYKTWNESICADLTPVSQANSNCSLSWRVQ